MKGIRTVLRRNGRSHLEGGGPFQEGSEKADSWKTQHAPLTLHRTEEEGERVAIRKGHYRPRGVRASDASPLLGPAGGAFLALGPSFRHQEGGSDLPDPDSPGPVSASLMKVAGFSSSGGCGAEKCLPAPAQGEGE